MILHMKGAAVALSVALVAASPVAAQETGKALEDVIAMDMRPGNVAVSPSGRVFATMHPLGKPNAQLVEIAGGVSVTYPSTALQKGNGSAEETLDTPLGIVVDKNNHLWTIDIGLELGKARLWSIDTDNNVVLEKIDLPADAAPKGSFVQDLAIDEGNGWAYLADIAKPAIIAVNLKTKEARRFESSPTLQTEDKDMIIDGAVINFGGKPARVGVNPITLSTDRETLYFGSMNGTAWYSVPAKLFRDKADDMAIAAAIQKVGDKPISDGAATDAAGNHYFTNLGEHGISMLSPDGKSSLIMRDGRIQWPDNVATSPDGWLYLSVNQLTTTPAFTGGADTGKPPYHIYRFKRP